MEITRDNNFTDKQIKGITISVKAAAKNFPFIKGWKLTENYEKYNAQLYIILIIDVEKLSEEVGLDIKHYYLERLQKGERIEFGAIFSLFNWGDYGTEEWTKMSDESYNFGTKIRETVSRAYTYLPEDMKIYYSGETSLGIYKNPVNLNVDNYLSAE